MKTPEPVLSVRHLSKTFPGQRALRDVSIDVLPGEIHALVGQNGSGKSTLIKCLSGYHAPDPGGEVYVGGAKVPLPIPANGGHRFGMAFIHQDVGIVPSLSVVENFCMGKGFATGFGFHIKWAQEADRVRRLMADFGHEISPWTLARNLSSSDRTIVAIVRALEDLQEENGQLLVLDEPTAALPNTEVNRLFAAIRTVASRGMGIMYVSHRLEEIFELADRVTVLRDGVRIGTYRIDELSLAKLIELIVGRALESSQAFASSAAGPGEALLQVAGLSGLNVHDASFSVRRGEIVGVAGLLGSGCSELGRLIFGADRRRVGKVWFKEREVQYREPSQAMKDGIAMVSEDRRSDGCFPQLTIRENMTITDLQRFWKKGWLQERAERLEVRDLMTQFKVNPPMPERRFYSLSGGNQQKVILAKWMRLKPDLLICDEPVVGVDIGSKTEIYGLIERAAAAGAGVMLISSEFEDLARLCSRVLVMRQGRISAELSGPSQTKETITHLAYASEEGGTQ